MLLHLIIILIVVGVLVWAAQRVIAVLPIAEPFRTVIYVLIVLFAVFFLMSEFNLMPASFDRLSR